MSHAALWRVGKLYREAYSICIDGPVFSVAAVVCVLVLTRVRSGMDSVEWTLSVS